MGIRHVRRIPHPTGRGGARSRRSNMVFHTSSGSNNASVPGVVGTTANSLAALTPTGRDTMDPIAGKIIRNVTMYGVQHCTRCKQRPYDNANYIYVMHLLDRYTVLALRSPSLLLFENVA